ncbi:MAG: hypothetical protein IRY85_15280 [Micromonosporaceae bacterium]|nr:hypothetical protein [Micromonosporaceae bacterium]
MEEPLFTDDPATMDLGAKVAAAWTDFQAALADTLAKMPETVAGLDITLDPSAAGHGAPLYSVSIDLGDAGQMRAYAVSNRMLPREHHLSRKRIGEVVALGWAPPGVVPGSGERFGLDLPRSATGHAAAIIARTLREVYGSPHPAFLLYTAVDKAGAAVADPPSLGVARPVGGAGVPQLSHVNLAALPLNRRVAVTLAAMLNVPPESLPVDADGDFGIRSGSAMVFVRVREQPPLVEVFSPVLTGVAENQRLYQRLSELVHRMPIGRLYLANGTIWAGITVFGRDYQPSHLMLALEVMTGLADELDDRLRSEFGGRRFFGDPDEGPEPEAPTNIGQYL